MGLSRILSELFKKEEVTDEEIAAAVKESMERTHRNRLPEKPGVLLDYSRFIGKYIRENDATLEEANAACRKAHPEYWPETVPQDSYFTQSFIQRNIDVDNFYDRIIPYLEGKGMIRYGDSTLHDFNYHSSKASVAMSFRLMIDLVTIHVASSEEGFIDDLIKDFELTEYIPRFIKKPKQE